MYTFLAAATTLSLALIEPIDSIVTLPGSDISIARAGEYDLGSIRDRDLVAGGGTVSLNPGVTFTNAGATEPNDSNIVTLGIDSGSTAGDGAGTVTVFIDGSLYLDYSVFTRTTHFTVSGSTSLTAQSIDFYLYDQTPGIDDMTGLTVLASVPNGFDQSGRFLFFSPEPIVDSVFEATGSIYIGNYAALAPVPLPASFALFFPALALLFAKGASSRRQPS